VVGTRWHIASLAKRVLRTYLTACAQCCNKNGLVVTKQLHLSYLSKGLDYFVNGEARIRYFNK
jgi:hypothetical protein